MSRLTLEENYNFDFVLFAINSSFPDYQICFCINNALEIDMHKESPIELQNKKQKGHLEFSMFQFYDEENFLNYELISNRSYNSVSAIEKDNGKKITQGDLFSNHEEATQQIGFLIPELEKTDYLLVVRTEYDSSLINFIEKSLKKIEEISSIRYVKPDDLNSKKNLIF